MNVLLLRLAGPMQSWGTQARFTVRDTGLEPSKSGVVGLLCAALGRPRDADISDLAKLRMGVRVDRPGTMGCDYQTAMDVIKADGKPSPPGQAVVSRRYYLADADFLVGLEGQDRQLLAELDDALANPVWPLFLGRKSFVLALPARIPGGLQSRNLRPALQEHSWERRPGHDDPPPRLRLVIESKIGEAGEVRYDQPVSFELGDRRFSVRHVRDEWMDLPPELIRSPEPCTSAD